MAGGSWKIAAVAAAFIAIASSALWYFESPVRSLEGAKDAAQSHNTNTLSKPSSISPETIRAIGAGAAVKDLKTQLTKPNSLKLRAVMTNEDASVVCIDFFARGFQGTSEATLVFVHEALQKSPDAWARNCQNNSLYDETSVAEQMAEAIPSRDR